jgi:hypothetical protein
MKFELNEVETSRAVRFIKRHNTHIKSTAIGGGFVYEIIPTSLGEFISVKCLGCKKHRKVTDLEKL